MLEPEHVLQTLTSKLELCFVFMSGVKQTCFSLYDCLYSSRMVVYFVLSVLGAVVFLKQASSCYFQ